MTPLMLRLLPLIVLGTALCSLANILLTRNMSADESSSLVGLAGFDGAQHLLDRRSQPRQVVVDDRPDDRVIDQSIAVAQHIADVGDVAPWHLRMLGLALIGDIVGFLRQSGERVLELTGVDAAGRTCANLLRIARPDDAAADLLAIKPLPPLRQLAREAATTREHVTNTLNRLYAKGYIRRRGISLYIMNRTALQDLAQGVGKQHDPDATQGSWHGASDD